MHEKIGLLTLKIEIKTIHNLKWKGLHSIENTTEFKVLKRGLYTIRIMHLPIRQPRVYNLLKVCKVNSIQVARRQ